MITAGQLLKALQEKHTADVFVAECKNGPTQTAHHLRMDAWVMNKSWLHPRSIGYEIKVSRQDFLNDKKWPAYLPYCNEFYFVSPPGIIDPKELPAEAGLMVAFAEGSKVMTKKRAAWRDVQIPENLYRYILMCRTAVRIEDNCEYWRDWLAQKAESRDLGYQVSRTIRDHVHKIQEENRKLKAQMESYGRPCSL